MHFPKLPPLAAALRLSLRAARVASVVFVAPVILAGCDTGNEGADGSTGEMPADAPPSEAIVVDGDFATPESVLHDESDDVYLVSNIDGEPLGEDGNGFISRVSPEGEIVELRWIDGEAEGVELNAPKGMAIRGDTLYVADIDCVRMFARTTGEPAGEVCFPEASFLNDVTADANGTLYVTDTGLDASFEPTGSDAVYRFDPDGRQARLAQGRSLGNPNGIAFGPRGGFVVSFGSGEVYQLGPEGEKNPVMTVENGQLDGIVFTSDGGFLFSSWGDRSVTRVTAEGRVETVMEDVEAPADIGYDATRNRVLVPLFNGNRILIHELGPPSTGAGGG